MDNYTRSGRKSRQLTIGEIAGYGTHIDLRAIFENPEGKQQRIFPTAIILENENDSSATTCYVSMALWDDERDYGMKMQLSCNQGSLLPLSPRKIFVEATTATKITVIGQKE